MKILITTDLFTTDTNGVVTSVRNLREELERKGHDVRILTLSENYRSRCENKVSYIRSLPVYVYPNVRMSFASGHRFIRELIAWRPDVIHSQCEFFTFRFARYIAKRTGAPIIHTYHTMYEQYVGYLFPSKRFGRWFVRAASRHLLKRVETIVAPTQKVEATLRGYEIEQPIRVVPSGISLEQFGCQLSDDLRCERRAALGFFEEHTVLVNLGRLGTEKNLGEILELFAKAHSTTPTLRLLIVGDGPAKHDLEKQAAKLGVADAVVFTGMVPPCEVQNYYQLGDIFVSASTSETQGLTYVEAAANALPLLCREDPCLEEILLSGENGYTYTCEAEFLNRLAEMLADPAWQGTAGKCSLTLSKRFDKRVFGDAIEQIYQEALASNG